MRNLILLLLVLTGVTAAAQPRDGRLFDPGVEMTKPSDGAPKQLSDMQYLIGQWDVEYRSYRADTLYESGSGVSAITFMNRGHGIMERWSCEGCAADGEDLATLSFLGFNQAANAWNIGTADAYKETISVSSGHLADDRLVLHNAIRHNGGATLTYYKTTYTRSGEGFQVEVQTSTDYQQTWHPLSVRTYRTRAFDPDFLTAEATYGRPAPDRPEEASEFDFLIGTFDAAQEITFPNGQVAKFPSTTTAVYALDGLAILEFGWYDVDPNLPDAATSIIRLYNRSMQRWESLYMANRGNGALFFGGRKEGDNLVLGLFETDLSRVPISRFVFHNIREDGYDWYAESSRDRGETFNKTWIIDADRTES